MSEMRALIIDELSKEAVEAVRKFAECPENYYIVGQKGFSMQFPPGDDPRHVCMLNTYRCVFSMTRANGWLWRHFSMSVPSKDYPNPFAVWLVCELFGFTGWDGKSELPPSDWQAMVNKEEHCIVVAQREREGK